MTAGIRQLKLNAEKTSRWGVSALFILFLLSYFLIPYGTKYSGYGFHNLVLIAAVLPAVVYALSRKLLSRWEWVLLLGGSGTLLLSAAVHQASFAEFRPYLLTFVTYLVVRTGMSVVSAHKVLDGLAGYLIIAGGLALLQVHGGPAFYPARYLSDEHPFYATGFAHYPSIAALLLLWPLTLLIGEMVRYTRVRPFWWVAIFLGVYGLALTLSRGALLGFTLALVLVGIGTLLLKGQGTLKRYGIVCALALLSVGLAWSLAVPNRYSASASEKIISKVEQPQDVVEAVVVERLALWKAVSWMIADHPLWGTGISGYQEQLPSYAAQVREMPESLFLRYSRQIPHNSYLTWSVYWGLVSFVWVLVFVGLALWPLRRGPRLSWYASFGVALIAVLVDSTFHDFIGDRLFWIAMASAMSAGNFKNSKA